MPFSIKRSSWIIVCYAAATPNSRTVAPIAKLGKYFSEIVRFNWETKELAIAAGMSVDSLDERSYI